MKEPHLDPAERERLERDTAEPLARWAAARRAEAERAALETGDRDRARAVATFERLAGLGQARRPRPLRRWLTAAAVLIAGVAIGYLVRGRDARLERPPSVWLGEEPASEVAPAGEVDAYDLFSWGASESGPSRYRLTVWNLGEPEPALRTGDLSTSTYAPTPAELERLGPSIVWEAVRIDEDGVAVGRAGGSSASLRSR